MYHHLQPMVRNNFDHKRNSQKKPFLVGASLTYDIIDRLATDENAQCVILVQDVTDGQGYYPSPSNHNALIPRTLFEADIVTGIQLGLSGNFCPYMVMSFSTLSQATAFLTTHKDNLRFSS